MEQCLYGVPGGYYESGKVAFGASGDFWTWPDRLSPLFGGMVAERARELMAAMVQDGAIPDGAPLTLLELGAGNGALAGDVVAHVARWAPATRWRDLAGRWRYVVGETSSALRAVQARRLGGFVEQGWAEVRAMDARRLAWEGRFHGVVFANELVDAFPVERVRLYGRMGGVARVHVVLVPPPGDEGAGVAPVPRFLRSTVRSALPLEHWWVLGPDRRRLAGCREVEVPLQDGWIDEGGGIGQPPVALLEALEQVAPFVRDLEALDLLPVELFWAPGLAPFVEALARLVSGPDRSGAVMLIDYGGTSRHVLDPRADLPHLRVYGPDQKVAHRPQPYVDPGLLDMTWDVDFTELARLARAAGLRVDWYGPQGTLERPSDGLDDPAVKAALLAGRVAEGMDMPFDAVHGVEELVEDFRQGSGFRLMVLRDPRAGPPLPGPCRADPLDPPDLATLDPAVSVIDLASCLNDLGLPGREVARHLHPGGDPVSDLGNASSTVRWAMLDALAARGWLLPPGEIHRRRRRRSRR